MLTRAQGIFLTGVLWFSVCAIALAVSGLILEVRDTVVTILESP